MVIVPPAELCLQAERGEREGQEEESVPAWEERSPSEDWSGLGAAGLPRTGPEVP